jgi:hypothetical protein
MAEAIFLTKPNSFIKDDFSFLYKLFPSIEHLLTAGTQDDGGATR